jgi:hypothetical protein
MFFGCGGHKWVTPWNQCRSHQWISASNNTTIWQ